MSQGLESGIAGGGHLHSAISLAPPALCETWSASNTVEEFDFLAPQRRIRSFAAIGGMVMVLSALVLIGLLGSNDASARAGERTLKPGIAAPRLTAAAADPHVEPPSVPAEAHSTAPASSPAVLATAPEAAAHHTAAKPAARVRTKAKRMRRR